MAFEVFDKKQIVSMATQKKENREPTATPSSIFPPEAIFILIDIV